MDKMPSSQFRTTYSTLTSPVEVTVNGHAIGTWLPSPYSAAEFRQETAVGPRYVRVERDATGQIDTEHYSTRPFTPVPKKGK